MRDWVKLDRIVTWKGKSRMVYRHSLHLGLMELNISWLSWSSEPEI